MMHSSLEMVSKVIVLLLVAAVLLLVPIMFQNRYSALTLREISLRQAVDSLRAKSRPAICAAGSLLRFPAFPIIVAGKGIDFNSGACKS